jgi:hypothetical protein
MVDMLAIMIERAKVDGHIEGVVPHLMDGGLSILQYVYDTILFMEHEFETEERNLKLILSFFEQLSGLKINFHKVSCFVLARLKTRSILTPTCLAVGKGHIWAF